MKKVFWIIFVLTIVSSCVKGNSYCEQPFLVNSINDLDIPYNPASEIEITVQAELDFSKDQEKTLFSFSVPSIFVNPKGSNYPTDVTLSPKYSYILKDTSNYPDSVEIEVYTFNDCGKSEPVKGFIKFE
ncbi:MAG: hypothetical protein AB8B72_02720 [Crocinitomicaceae bacterium]